MNGDTKVKEPMAFRIKLTPLLEKPTIDLTLYRHMIGSLLYLTSRIPNIIFVVYYYARYQANQQETHIMVVKNIFKYLRITTSLGSWYPSNT